MNWDLTFHVADLVLIAGGAFGALRYLGRLVSLFEDFPPHRHDADRILYPKGFAPGRVERLV